MMTYLKYTTLVFIMSVLLSMQQGNQEDFLNMPEVYGKTDSIQAAINQGSDVIDLNGNMYVTDKQIDIWRDSITIQNGGFKRAATPVTYLAEPMDEGATYAVVEDASEFRVGHWLKVFTGFAYEQGDNSKLRIILNISGDTISFTNPQNTSAPVGAKIVRGAPLVRINTPTPTHIVLRNIVFDGNVLENDHTHDWRFNHTISIKSGVTLDSCTFMNTPAENIYQCGGVIKNCRYYRLGGSFVHWSCGDGIAPPLSIVENNSGRYSNLIGDLISVHSEALFTFSANSQNILVQGNTCENGKELVIGSQGHDDYNITVINNYFKNFKKKSGIVPNHQDPMDVSDNTFINVPD